MNDLCDTVGVGVLWKSFYHIGQCPLSHSELMKKEQWQNAPVPRAVSAPPGGAPAAPSWKGKGKGAYAVTGGFVTV